MFKVKEGLLIGNKQVTGDGPTEILTVMDVGEMAFRNNITQTDLDIGSLGFRNKIINGSMIVAARATSATVTASGYAALDRWGYASNGTFSTTISRQDFTAGTELEVGLYNYQRLNITSASSQTYHQLYQCIEFVRTFNGKQVTLSFWAKADAARSVTLGLHQNFGSGGSTQVDTSVGTANLSTAWQKFKYTVTLPSISGKTIGTNNYLALAINFPLNTVSTFDITGVQLEEGTVASSFEHRDLCFETMLCERFFKKIEIYGGGYGTASMSVIGLHVVPTTMRANPTATSISNYGNVNVSDPTVVTSATEGLFWQATVTAAGRWAIDHGYSLTAEF